jgi:hypothetical protein
MSRTVLATAALIGLIACSRGEKPTKTSAASTPAAGAHRTAPRAAPSKASKKKAAKPDTTPAKNPLTN